MGGSEARPGGWPWTVAIFRGGRFICGGSIINARYVLTAAHCVPRENRPESVAVYRVLVGAHRLHGSGRLVEATDIVRHESYDSQRMQNDIALIRLKQELSWAEKGPGQLGPVCLPPTMLDSGLEHSQSTVVGWGHVREGGAISPTLQEVKIPIIGNSECARVYGSRMVQAGNICAAHPQGGYDSCQVKCNGNVSHCLVNSLQGDSGGPMMVKRAGRQYQMGIVSWGTGCARPRAPGVYTRVSQFVHWILRRIRKFPKDIEDTSLPL